MRQIIYYKKYYQDFFDSQTEKVKSKIDQVLFLVTIAERIPSKFFHHLAGTEGLYEIRVEYASNTGYFAVLTKEKSLWFLMDFRKKARKPPLLKLKRL